MKTPKAGDYVLATKYSDGDPADAWCCGYYIRETSPGRYGVGDVNGGPGPNGFRFSGFSHIGLIDEELGNWLVKNAKELEGSPAGSINLWDIRNARLKLLLQSDSEHWAHLADEKEIKEFAE